jgi:NDP-sugar pyrophosphorylase family protein
MAGRGERFVRAGYTVPKPFIQFQGSSMVEHVVDAFKLPCHKIFIVLREHEELFGATAMLRAKWPYCDVVLVDHVTEGAACTVLLAEHLIDTNVPLAVLNSDNIIEWNVSDINCLSDSDGMIMTFEDTDPKWSFARTDADGYVTEVAEKNPISTHATAGLYFWKTGASFVSATKSMILKNFRVNNEFYVAPIYNENVEGGEKIIIRPVIEMNGVGTPEDLEKYLAKQAQK